MTEDQQNINPVGDINDYSNISPYPYEEFGKRIQILLEEPDFKKMIMSIMPEVDYETLKHQILACNNIDEFQVRIVAPFVEKLVEKTTSGVSMSGTENIDANKRYTFISNHRDIVLDATLMNLCFLYAHQPITQIAIGNNLLIYKWIHDFVRINRSFIVRRDVKKLEALAAARQLAGYIHHAITQMHESVWIAQREGRAKDSNDVTQESLIKMLTLAGPRKPLDSLMEIDIVPVSISYEFDPNDYLKVKEFILRRRDPEFKKTQQDDLFSMQTGIMQFKGHIHFTVNHPINTELQKLSDVTDRNSVLRTACELIDKEIYLGYKIYPINYIAYDLLNDSRSFADKYTPEQEKQAGEYFLKQLQRIDVPGGISDDEKPFANEMLLKMYANPLINQLIAQNTKSTDS